MKSSVVEELEHRFLPSLERTAELLRWEFPRVQISTWSWTTGVAVTDNPSHDLGIDCVFPDAPPDSANNVALWIGLLQIYSGTHLSDLSVSWGAGVGGVSTHLIDVPLPWSADAIAKIESGLPILFDALRKELSNPPFQTVGHL